MPPPGSALRPADGSELTIAWRNVLALAKLASRVAKVPMDEGERRDGNLRRGSSAKLAVDRGRARCGVGGWARLGMRPGAHDCGAAAVGATSQPAPTQVVPATTAAPPPGPGPTLVPVPAYQIIVKVNTPSATYPCNPAGSIEVYGTGFPVTVTHEWRYRAVLVGAGNGAPLGAEVTHGYNVEGGKAISSQKLPAGKWQVQLRVTSPKLIETEWVTHNPCSG